MSATYANPYLWKFGVLLSSDFDFRFSYKLPAHLCKREVPRQRLARVYAIASMEDLFQSTRALFAPTPVSFRIRWYATSTCYQIIPATTRITTGSQLFSPVVYTALRHMASSFLSIFSEQLLLESVVPRRSSYYELLCCLLNLYYSKKFPLSL